MFDYKIRYKGCDFQEAYKRGNSHMSFRFVGYEKIANTDPCEKQKLINKCFDKINAFNSYNIKKCVTWVRTILRDYNEEYLQVIISNKREKIQIEYLSKRLSYFKLEEDVYSKDKFTTTYSLYDFCTSIPENSESEETIREYEEKEKRAKDLIASLKECYILSEDMYIKDENICELYKLFYNENPDFSSKEIDTKMQAMYYVLQYFYIDMTYAFDKALLNSAMPFSTKLQMDVERLTPFGKVEVRREDIKISEFNKRKIETIGGMVQKETQGQIENLISFVSTLYNEELEKRYQQTPDLDTIAKTTGIELEHILDNLELARKIEKETDKIKK